MKIFKIKDFVTDVKSNWDSLDEGLEDLMISMHSVENTHTQLGKFCMFYPTVLLIHAVYLILRAGYPIYYICFYILYVVFSLADVTLDKVYKLFYKE